MSSRTEILNATLKDLRQRVDTLARSIFLIGGASITLSVNLYLAKKSVLQNIVGYLKNSWILFLLSILIFATVIGLLIIQSFISTEFYRSKVNDKKIESHPRRCFDYLALILGIVGFVLFFLGMTCLVKAASHL